MTKQPMPEHEKTLDQFQRVIDWMRANGHEDRLWHISPAFAPGKPPTVSMYNLDAFKQVFQGRTVTRQLRNGWWEYSLTESNIEFRCHGSAERPAYGEPHEVTL